MDAVTSSLVDLESGAILAEQPGATHFDRLGLDPAAEVDADEVERRYLRLSRALHPDFQAAADDETRTRAVRNSALLNEAYGVLLDDARRLEYLLHLSDPDALERNKTLPPAFLMASMEWDEEAEAARGKGDTDALAALAERAGTDAAARLDRARAALQTDPPDVDTCAVQLHEARVLRRIARDAAS